MGAIAGTFAFGDSQLKGASEVESSIVRYGKGRSAWGTLRGNACARHEFTAREQKEYRTVCSPKEVVCCWNGRIDNRAELELHLPSPVASLSDDAALALAVYDKWGTSGLSRIVGDWSAAFVDMHSRTFVLARDYFGARQLFYTVTETGVEWSSSLGALVHRRSAYANLDDEYLVGTIMGLRMPGRTPYTHIRSLGPGTAATWGWNGDLRVTRLWHPPERQLSCTSYGDYQDMLRNLFRDAIATRLRYPDPAWSQLSGGLDSTAIVCMADRLIRSGSVGTVDFQTVTFYTEGLPSADERPYARIVEEHTGRRAHYLGAADYQGQIDSVWSWVTPRHRDGVQLASCQLARREGATTLLTGSVGDLVMGNIEADGFDVAAHLSGWHLGISLTEARSIAREERCIVYEVLADAASVLWPGRWGAYRRMRQRLRNLGNTTGTITEQVRETFLVTERHSQLWVEEMEDDWSRAVSSTSDLSKARLRASLDSEESLGFYECEGLVTTHPMSHRPLVEFIFSIPTDIWRPTGRRRALMRDAFAPFMPPRTIARQTKGEALPSAVRNVMARTGHWMPQLDDLLIVKRGYVDRERLRGKLHAIEHSGCEYARPLPALLRLETWLRTRDAHAESFRSSTTSKGEHDHGVQEGRTAVRRDGAEHRAHSPV